MRKLWPVTGLVLALGGGCFGSGVAQAHATEINASSRTDSTAALRSLRLTVDAATLNKDHNTTLSVTARYDDNTTRDYTDRVQWLITPAGAVKITGHTLTALKDVNVTLRAKAGSLVSNPVSLSIYWEVGGHRLPPEPDPKINNATLLGVDVNHNGVRDDVERKVYTHYKKAIERAVMMQAFKTAQAMLADPELVKHAREWAVKEDKVIDCNRYLHLYKKQKRIKIFDSVHKWQFNNIERVKLFFKYDQALSGGVYSIKEPTSKDCNFDIDRVLEMDK